MSFQGSAVQLMKCNFSKIKASVGTGWKQLRPGGPSLKAEVFWNNDLLILRAVSIKICLSYLMSGTQV